MQKKQKMTKKNKRRRRKKTPDTNTYIMGTLEDKKQRHERVRGEGPA